MTLFDIGERTTLFCPLLAFLRNRAINIIKKATRAKKEVGKGSKMKQPGKIETKNRKPETHNLSK